MAPQLYGIIQTHPPFQNMLQYLHRCICSHCCFSKLRIPNFMTEFISTDCWVICHPSKISDICARKSLLFICQILECHNSILILRVQWVGVKRLNVVLNLQSFDTDNHCINVLNSWFFTSFLSASTDINWYSLL